MSKIPPMPPELPLPDGSPPEAVELVDMLRQFEIRDMGYTTPCWIWTGVLAGGYGVISPTKTPDCAVHAHRLTYSTMIGPLILGLVLDHLCEQKACVNPYHLEQVTSAVNIQRYWENRRKRGDSPLERKPPTFAPKSPLPYRLFYKVDEVERLLKASKRTVYRRIKDGTIPSMRIRGCVRIPITEFHRLFGDCE
jgi:excisionase family DNA binding protein